MPLGVPVEHKSSSGSDVATVPLALPQSPFTAGPGGGGAGGIFFTVVQELAVPPFMPEQVQVHGPSPYTSLGNPLSQRLAVGLAFAGAEIASPQLPSTRTSDWAEAEQLALVPPPEPAQVHVHGPVPCMPPTLPELQRLLSGANF
jgi:hypothetical protein